MSLQEENRRLREALERNTQGFIQNAMMLHEYLRAIDLCSLVANIDTQGYLTHANELLLGVCKFERGELLGKRLGFLMHPNAQENLPEQIWTQLSTKHPWQGVLHGRTREGGAFYADVTIVPLLGEEEQVVEYLLIARDITALILQEREIERLRVNEMIQNVERARELRLQEVLDALPLPSLILDKHGRILHANSEYSALHPLGGEIQEEPQGLLLHQFFLCEEPWWDDPQGWLAYVAQFQGSEEFVVGFDFLEPERRFRLKATLLPEEGAEEIYLLCLLSLQQ